ncbi:MAG: bifunctional nuclease family protein [Flavobacteriales bacterium]|nr:bifunctional nuclease family protein [Flavobacteriales bacterium]
MDKIELSVVGLSYSQTQTGAYALILKEKSGNRRLPIIIGGAEAQAIAIPLEKMTPSRPLTHDLFKTFLDNFEIQVSEVIIHNLVEGIFFAKIICMKDGKEVELDARSSDAVALALRCDVPVYTHDFILGSAGIIIDENDEEEKTSALEAPEEIRIDSSSKQLPSDTKSIADLERQLQKALEKEDYEKASKIRDEINRRSKK